MKKERQLSMKVGKIRVLDEEFNETIEKLCEKAKKNQEEKKEKLKEKDKGELCFKDALEIAKKYKNNIGSCIEYENGYVFYSNNTEFMIGGKGTPLVVTKKERNVIPMNAFVADGTGEEIKEWIIEE